MTAPPRLVAFNTVATEIERARLRGILRAVHDVGGWGAVEEMLQTEVASVSAELREDLASEGWIR